MRTKNQAPRREFMRLEVDQSFSHHCVNHCIQLFRHLALQRESIRNHNSMWIPGDNFVLADKHHPILVVHLHVYMFERNDELLTFLHVEDIHLAVFVDGFKGVETFFTPRPHHLRMADAIVVIIDNSIIPPLFRKH